MKLFLKTMFFIIIFSSGALAQQIDEDKINSLKKEFKETFETEVSGIKPFDIPDFYEINTDEGILYYHMPTKSIFIGALIRNGINLTEQAMNERISQFVQEAEKISVLVRKGKNKVLLITDPDCPFCKKVDNFLKTKDVELRVIFYPLRKIHPLAEKKVSFVLDSADKEKAYKEVIEGKVDVNKIGQDVIERQKNTLKRHEDVVKKLQVRGTPALWVNGQRIDGADIDAIERNLK